MKAILDDIICSLETYAGVLVKLLMVGGANSMVGYHLMAEDHSIQLAVLGGAMTFLEKVFEYRP